MIFKNLKNEATSFLDQYKNDSPAAYAAAQQAIGGLLILDGFTGIDNPFGGKKRPGIFGTLAGVVVGAVLLFVPNLFGNITGINQMTATTEATIVSINQQQQTTTDSNGNRQNSTTCTPTAKYTVNGKEYTQASSISSSGACSLVAGQKETINYNPDNPVKWSSDVKTFKTIMKFFPWVGLIVLVTSLFTFTIRLLSIIFGWKLLKSGRALAKTLPEGTNLATSIKEIEHSFKGSLFGFGSGAPAATPQPPAPPTNPPQN